MILLKRKWAEVSRKVYDEIFDSINSESSVE